MVVTEKAEAEKILQIKKVKSKYLSGVVNVHGTTTKDVMDMVLVTQYFDIVKEIRASSKSSVVFIPHGPADVRDVTPQICDGLLQGNVTH
ncbi:hypersensitive-induced response protein 1-like [Lactuca sativa]|uniref:Band 7 domain-containing protein n=1 Tax=Lactuca sativa TaxID=4236 RepID=A0A9R1VGU6_LACSA|nr:hypersensitive-induced response protein 1-like [Lactuca sativa]KAJ0205873.1 hypothetical protein LSAT_V11C500275980 [Lactuca sativa]